MPSQCVVEYTVVVERDDSVLRFELADQALVQFTSTAFADSNVGGHFEHGSQCTHKPFALRPEVAGGERSSLCRSQLNRLGQKFQLGEVLL